MNVVMLLRRNPVFARAADATLKWIAQDSEVCFVDGGRLITEADTPQTHVVFIADGQVELFYRNEEENAQLLHGLLEAPSIYGDADLYAAVPWTVSSRAVGSATIVKIPNENFDRAITMDHNLAAGLYREASARHALAVKIVQFIALQSTEHQILRLLWEDAHQEGEHSQCVVNQVRLAEALGVNRKTIARNLKEMEKRGIIEVRGRMAVLLRGPALSEVDPLQAKGFGASWRMGKREGSEP